ncbi:MAG: biotin-dependent carboxyltransferase family protein [Desulfarculaceae bacterium]|nr:biotin-dependent carboxyltransferase family protein [Desulfarculaceae bacterium]
MGNDPGDAALEITLMGPRLKALRPVVIAVTGCDLGLTIDGKPAPTHQALALAPGQVLGFRGPRHGGARAMLSLAGGAANERLLGSRSTYLLGRMGAPLSKGDVVRSTPGPLPPAGAACPALEEPSRVLTLRVVPGPNQEFFSPQGLETFYKAQYELTAQADRRGARLEGPALSFAPGSPASLVSEPNTPGVIQVPSGGQPIIMLREQTVGGYPKIGTVFGPDLDHLARAQSGQAIRFAPMSAEEAVAEARRLNREFQAARERTAD